MRGAVVRRTASIELSELQSRPELTGATGRFFVTPHAVHKYIREIAPRMSYTEALARLIIITSAGRLQGPYLGAVICGQYPGVKLEMWTGPIIGESRRKQKVDSRLRFCVAHGPLGELPQVVTILRRNQAPR